MWSLAVNQSVDQPIQLLWLVTQHKLSWRKLRDSFSRTALIALVAERPPVRPTGPPGSQERGAFRQQLQTRSRGSAAFRLRGRASRLACGAGVDVCVSANVYVCVCACARVGWGCAGSQIPLGAHPELCLRLPLVRPLAQGPGFRISCLMRSFCYSNIFPSQVPTHHFLFFYNCFASTNINSSKSKLLSRL